MTTAGACQTTNKVSNPGNPRVTEAAERSLRFKLLDIARRLAPGRTQECLWHAKFARDGEGQSITVYKNRATGGMGFSGVKVCGSVWSCPVCASKIAARRAMEVQQVAKAAEAAGVAVYMGALTVPHDRFQSCKALREAVSLAFKRMQQGRAWKDMRAAGGNVQMIRALEVTHGKNGWHPHLHVLFFMEGERTEEQAQQWGRWFFSRWQSIVADMGLGRPTETVWQFERARVPSDAAGYVAKWARELTMGTMKAAKGGNRSPWQLLLAYDAGDDLAGILFRDYAESFKGARQLTWSHGLKARFDVEDVSDEEAADAEEPEREVVALIRREAWAQVTRRGLIGNVIRAAYEGGAASVEMLLEATGIENPMYRPPVPTGWRRSRT